MMTNTTLMHIQRNMRQLDSIIRQIETGQRASRPSDNPLVASRALQFRTSVRENEQFRNNVDQGMAWMNITEATFTNINSQLMSQLRDLAVNGASGQNNLSNKQTIVEQMRSIFQQMGNAVNNTFAGQYLFSGFRTNEPPTFKTDNNRSFVITQHFQLRDISREQSFQRLADPSNNNLVSPRLTDVNVLRLAFGQLDTTPLRPPAGSTPLDNFPRHIDNPAGINIAGFHVRKVSIHDPQAYAPPHMTSDAAFGAGEYPAGALPSPALPVLHLIAETGELVMHADTAENFPREGLSVTYQRTGFRKGDINPAVYFTSREILNTANPGGMITPGFPLGGTIPNVNTVYSITQYLSRASGVQFPPLPATATHFDFPLVHTVYMPTNAEALLPQFPPGSTFDPATNTVRIPAQIFDLNNHVSVTYSTANPHTNLGGFAGGTPPWSHIKEDTRIQGVSLVRAIDPATGLPVRLETVDLNNSFDMNDQAITYEVSTRTQVQVNSLAKNILTDKMFADFRRFFQFADSLHVTSEAELTQFFSALGYEGEGLTRVVGETLVSQESQAVAALQTQFDNMLLLIDRHAQQSNREQTQLGARMVRMELIQDRLEQDEVAYNRLMSENENTDLVRATILRMSAEAAFMASLQANSGIVQMSLANFMR